MEILSFETICDLLDTIEGEEIVFDRVCHHNKEEIRKSDSMNKNKLKAFIAEAIENEHQPGGDIEIKIPSIQKILVGMHDGIYWIE